MRSGCERHLLRRLAPKMAAVRTRHPHHREAVPVGGTTVASPALVVLLVLLSAWPLRAAAVQADEAARQAFFAQQVLVRVNGYRTSQGLGQLQPDAGLTAIAAEHSRRMAQRQRIGHDGFDQRFARSRRNRCVETLAADFTHADALLAGWLASPAHQAQLRVPQVRDVGVASVEGYVTLLACE